MQESPKSSSNSMKDATMAIPNHRLSLIVRFSHCYLLGFY